VDTWVHGIAAPSAAYEIAGRRFEVGDRGFAEAVADAHAAHQRPRCLCVVGGVEMYVARLASPNEGYIVKRMPDTGSHHAADCPSYEPPAELSGLGQVLGSAITEDPATGETTLKLDFPLTRMPGRSQAPPSAGDGSSVATDRTRLSLRGLLHYLWDQAELTRWHPGFAGKRSWATVRRHLLQAAEHKIARGQTLLPRLYIPEVFSVEQRDAIHARRLAQWAQAMPQPGRPRQLMLIVGEVKEIVPARYGYKAVIKHVPDQGFAIDEQLYRRLGRCFAEELALWGSSDAVHMMMFATLSVSEACAPALVELTLMLATAQWLPIEDELDRSLVERLVHEGRSFTKTLRFNGSHNDAVPCAVLLDCGSQPVALHIARPSVAVSRALDDGSAPAHWTWDPSAGDAQPIPSRQLAGQPMA
jgi:hypothetical protein